MTTFGQPLTKPPVKDDNEVIEKIARVLKKIHWCAKSSKTKELIKLSTLSLCSLSSSEG